MKFKDLTTFKTGGEISYFFDVENEKELVEKIKFAKENNLPIFVIGEGSDILVSDKDYKGVVVRYMGDSISYVGNSITAEAGLVWDKLVEFAVNKNLGGIECLSAIPGTVGAAPIQNIGAYGQELKDTFVNLGAYDIEKEMFVTFSNSDCKFGYRDSIFKDTKYWQKFVITEITLKLYKDIKPNVIYESLKKYLPKNPTLQEVRDAVISVRSKILEDWHTMPNAGSYFKNPIIPEAKKEKLEKVFPDIKNFKTEKGYKIFAGWLIENAGWKGRSLGKVKVSDKHSLIITNPNGQGRTKDILKLAKAIQKDVLKKYGIVLEPEVQYVKF